MVLEDAAGWHDLGKVEERFQVMLHDGHADQAALAVEPLAKSGMDPSDRMAFRRARRRSGLPAGARHEAWSAALVEEYVRAHEYPGDVDLLVHLVASHHGYADRGPGSSSTRTRARSRPSSTATCRGRPMGARTGTFAPHARHLPARR